MIFGFNSRSDEYKSPFGAIASGDSVRLKVTAKDGLYIENIMVSVFRDGEAAVEYPMPYSGKADGVSEFTTTVYFPQEGIYWYSFRAFTEAGQILLGRGAGGDILANSKKFYQQTVYRKGFKTPSEPKGGVIYHIFIDRFNRGADTSAVFEKKGALKNWGDEITIADRDGVFRANDFYGGNFQGIIDKLDYLEGLGVTQIYLSPIFKSSSNHRYDTGDYFQLDELLGDESKFRELIAKAKARGIGVILDGVFNHTGADSKYFNKFKTYDSVGAYQGIKSPYFDWYYFINFPEEYACWWGITVTPTVNKHSETYREFIYGEKGVIDKWTNFGISGWRLDVVDELDIDFMNELCGAIKRVDKDALVIGEVWEDASTKVAYGTLRPYLLGQQLDGVMNYPFKKAILEYCVNANKDLFTDQVMNIVENYPKQVLDCCMTLIGTHDTVRVINSLSGVNLPASSDKAHRLERDLTPKERDRGTNRVKLASLLQFTLPGIPSIYYGDEVGQEGFEDPINRRPFPWNNMDEEILSHYKRLGAMREKFREELVGDIRFIPHNKLLVYTRSSDKRVLTVLCNNTRENIEWQAKGYSDAFTDEKCGNVIIISPHSFKVIYC